ncbi:MAG: hypothetical protein HY319_15115 [Armatimonadetes bacterium]|nr:hypothetical protein [Armatimonadota bacterium]
MTLPTKSSLSRLSPVYNAPGLVDLEQRTITAYLDPTPSGYRTARVFRRGERVAPSAFPDRAIAISDILPE